MSSAGTATPTENRERESAARTNSIEERQWATTAGGLKLLKWGYVLAFICFGLAILVAGPDYVRFWPLQPPDRDLTEQFTQGQTPVPPLADVRLTEFFAAGTVVYLVQGGLFIGLFVIMLGLALCGTIPTTMGRLLAFAALILLIGSLFVQTLQASISETYYLSPGSGVNPWDISAKQTVQVILRILALALNLTAHLFVLFMAKHIASQLQDRSANQLCVLSLGVLSIYFFLTVVIATIVQLMINYEGTTPESRDSSRFLQSLAQLPQMYFYSWCFLGILMFLLLFVSLYQIRALVNSHLKESNWQTES